MASSYDLVGTIESEEEIEDLDDEFEETEESLSEKNDSNGNSTSAKRKRPLQSTSMSEDFLFDVDPNSNLDDLQGWQFDAVATNGHRRGVDIDEIISKRRKASDLTGNSTQHSRSNLNSVSGRPSSPSFASHSESGDEDEDEAEFTGFDSHDEDISQSRDVDPVPSISEGGFDESSPVVDTDDELSGSEESEDEDPEEKGNAGVDHPDDLASEDGDPDEVPISAAEAQRQKDFFAPEEAEGPIDLHTAAQRANFQHMNLSRPIMRALTALNFSSATPIQAKAIPVALLGKDVVGGAVTGSGKTAAFMIPILERLLYRPKKVSTTRVLILCPTRELAMQCYAVAKNLAKFTDIRSALVVGGLSLKVQELELRTRPDIVIATPGRFIDHVRNSQGFSVENIEIMVMDEADRMLEEGFAEELNEIINACPRSRQTMLFSATMTDKIDDLIRLSLNKPVRLLVDAKKTTAEHLIQEFVRIRPQREHTRASILVHLCTTIFTQRVIVFFRSKVFAHKMRITFGLLGLRAGELHGNLSQEQRIQALESFRDGKIDFLLATDVASRGLDIKAIDTVINYEAPQTHEIYLHRVGRTARAGRQGRSITLAGEGDRKVVKAAVKSSNALKSKVQSRTLDTNEIDAIYKNLEGMEEEIQDVLREEAQERQLRQAEMELKKGENSIKFVDEIKSRPRRTWFATEAEKKQSAQKGLARLNPEASRQVEKKRELPPTSNKQKKKLDNKRDRSQQSKKKPRAMRQK